MAPARLLVLLSSLLSSVAAAEMTVHNVTRFANLEFENLAVRANGQILTTSSGPVAQLYQVDLFSIRSPALHALGISELGTDVFYVAVGNASVTDPTSSDPKSLGLSPAKLQSTRWLAFPRTGSLYYTNSGAASLFKIPIQIDGHIPAGAQPLLMANGLSCGDFVIDDAGNAYVVGPANVMAQVTPQGQKTIVAGKLNSTSSPLISPTAA
ncbi:MAG: hypothetical protein M4579_007386 [Chaenotheca gracillima]|nr:MAG: hypothetical protein M4579_007386 [Chaenotheca gracillima]